MAQRRRDELHGGEWEREREQQGAGGSRSRDVSGNDYAELSGMSALDRAALEAAKRSWQESSQAGDQAGMDAAHRQAEALRSRYGYSGGEDGSQYIPTAGARFSYQKAPDYTSRYQAEIDALREQIQGRKAFSYDPEQDESYQQYKKSYTQAGERAMEDTLGQVSARTGGLVSSYAQTAGQQEYDRYMAALADKVPELRQLAYQMYQDEGAELRAELAMLQGLEDTDYGRYRDALGQYNSDRNFAYGAFADAQEQDYRARRDSISDERYDREYADERSDKAYERAWNEDKRAYERAWNEDERDYQRGSYASERDYERAQAKAKQMAQAGDFSGFRALGYTDGEIAALREQWDKDEAAKALAGGGSQDYEGLFSAAQESGYPEVFLENNYKKYGFSSAKGLGDAFESWKEETGGTQVPERDEDLSQEAYDMLRDYRRSLENVPGKYEGEVRNEMINKLREALENGMSPGDVVYIRRSLGL